METHQYNSKLVHEMTEVERDITLALLLFVEERGSIFSASISEIAERIQNNRKEGAKSFGEEEESVSELSRSTVYRVIQDLQGQGIFKLIQNTQRRKPMQYDFSHSPLLTEKQNQTDPAQINSAPIDSIPDIDTNLSLAEYITGLVADRNRYRQEAEELTKRYQRIAHDYMEAVRVVQKAS